jgi:hypothetical protein
MRVAARALGVGGILFGAMTTAMAGATPDILARVRHAAGAGGWCSINTLHFTTVVTSGGMSGTGEWWEDLATGRYVVRHDFPLFSTIDGFDGVTPWHQGPSGIAYALGDVDSALNAANESFRVSRGWLCPERHAATFAPVEGGGNGEDGVEITPEGGRAFTAYFDAKTHDLLRTVEQQAEDRVVTRYSGYLSMMHAPAIPMSIRTGDGENPDEDDVETVKQIGLNMEVPDRVFNLPRMPPVDIALPPGRAAVSVKFRLTEDNRVLVPISIGGKALEAEFDSGGGFILQPAMVQALGLNAEGHVSEGGGGEGRTQAGYGRVPVLAIGDATISGLTFHSFAFAPTAPARALIGQEVLQRFTVELDFDRDVMTLIEPGAYTPPLHAAVIPFHFQDNQPEVKGALDGIAGLFTIDTGDTGSLLVLAPFARRYGLIERYDADIPYAGHAVGATKGVLARKRVTRVDFFGADGRPAIYAEEPVTRLSRQTGGFDANRNVSANIGLGILRKFNLTFDYSNQRIVFVPNGMYHDRDVFNNAGLRLKPQGSAWAVQTVYATGPADKAGIKEGDVISAIDGQGPDVLDADAVLRKFKALPGVRVTLRVGSGPSARDVTLVLWDFI